MKDSIFINYEQREIESDIIETLSSSGWKIISNRFKRDAEKSGIERLMSGGKDHHDFNRGWIMGIRDMFRIIEKYGDQARDEIERINHEERNHKIQI